MTSQDFIKMNKMDKSELIEWLIEMYENENRLLEIISAYEEACGTICEYKTKIIKGFLGEPDKVYCYDEYRVRINGKDIHYRRGKC